MTAPNCAACGHSYDDHQLFSANDGSCCDCVGFLWPEPAPRRRDAETAAQKTASPYASLDEVEARARKAWRPPPHLSLSEWADEHFYLSAESAATPGRWHTLPYQRAILDAITDPRVTHVSVMKSARVGYTKCINAAIGYHMHHAPASVLVVQPTVDDAKGYSKEEVAPMLRDCPELAKIVFEDVEENGPRDSGNTILHKRYPGGVLSMVGANSGAGFRRISRKVVIFDEVDAYPSSAGSDGDPIKLGTKRAEYFHDRKIIAGSTPLIAGHSRIESLFLAGDQRRFYVPCPHCGHFDHLVFSERADGHGHFLQFDREHPEDAHFVCSRNGCVIEHKHKREMVSRGEWRASAPFTDHASFHIWAAYSFSPNATWAHLAAEFLEANAAGPDQLKTFVNTVLGETWQERGEAPDWSRLYHRREPYQPGTVPAGARFLTCGVDVQKDRWVYEVVGWSGREKESWSIDAGVIMGDTSNDAEWSKLDELIARTYESPAGPMAILCTGVDSGAYTQTVYNWCRRHERHRVIATKGVSKQKAITSSPTAVDVNYSGKRIARGYKVWPIGVDVAKEELYGWLRLDFPGEGRPFPPGWCHFSDALGEDYFKQLTAEILVTTKDRRGFPVREWQKLPGRENHWLDCRIYARAAAATLGIDRMAPVRPEPPPAPLSRETVLLAPPVGAPPTSPRTQIRANRRPGSWLARRR